MARFARKPWREMTKSIGFRWVRSLPGLPFPIRLSNGCWWLVRNDACGAAILDGRFEETERRFVESYLQPGMTFLDIGAHHGLYTLLASRRVRAAGRVIAFEPSPRERKFLARHVRLNRCRNVTIQPFALGNHTGTGKLFLIEGRETGCNSLRPPEVKDPIREMIVPIRRLDQVLEKLSIEQVDLIKLDAEGGELDILRGAGRVLERSPRPVILAEVQDIRTRPWGYEANEILRYLSQRGYSWFVHGNGGQMEEVGQESVERNHNFVAVPQEAVGAFLLRFSVFPERSNIVLAASA